MHQTNVVLNWPQIAKGEREVFLRLVMRLIEATFKLRELYSINVKNQP